MASDHDTLVFMARVADQAERYEDMVNFLQEMVNKKDSDLNVEERNLLSVGFKNQIGSRRAAWRTVSAIEQNKKYEQYSADCAEYKKQIEGELVKMCEDIIGIVNDGCLPKSGDDEAKTFYLKMIGDYYRYISESVTGDKLKEVSDKATDYYAQAETAADSLQPYNSIRLGLALNYSVFYYEVRNDKKKACELAQTALDNAKAHVEDMENDEARDALSIVELLKENLDLWKEGEDDDGDDGGQVEDL